jgi:hypothetical protein
MIVTFIHTRDDIFRAVKQDTSYLAERTKDSAGTSMFEDIVYDEEYEVQFKRYFLEAQADILELLSAYTKSIPVAATYTDFQNFDENNDFLISISMPETYNTAQNRVVDVRIRQYFVSHVIKNWLKDKLPAISAMYSDEIVAISSSIRKSLEARTAPRVTTGNMF